MGLRPQGSNLCRGMAMEAAEIVRAVLEGAESWRLANACDSPTRRSPGSVPANGNIR